MKPLLPLMLLKRVDRVITSGLTGNEATLILPNNVRKQRFQSICYDFGKDAVLVSWDGGKNFIVAFPDTLFPFWSDEWILPT